MIYIDNKNGIEFLTCDFNEKDIEQLKTFSDYKYIRWPVVYLLYSKRYLYVGETSDVYFRMKKHLCDEEKKNFQKIMILGHPMFHLSATKDFESKLIRYMNADRKFIITNKNEGLYLHNYYGKDHYEEVFESFWNTLKEISFVTNPLTEIQNNTLYKLSAYVALNDEQHKILDDVLYDIENRKQNIVIHGLAGTGKTVLALHLIKRLSQQYGNKMSIGLIIPQTNFRSTVKKVLNATYGLSSCMVFTTSSIAKHKKESNKPFDLIIVDESHRLKRRFQLSNGGEYKAFDTACETFGLQNNSSNQLQCIESYSKQQILFYDEFQKIRPSDIPKKDMKSYLQNSKSYHLFSQMRCLGGDDYLYFIKNLFNCSLNKNKEYEFEKYELKLFDNIKKMKTAIVYRNQRYGLSRMVAGYAWEWDNKNNPTFYIDGLKVKWNTKRTDWINSQNAINELRLYSYCTRL